jgi:hypothetical protein
VGAFSIPNRGNVASAYQRRNERMQAMGWKSYGEMRRAAERVNRNANLSDKFAQSGGRAGSKTANDLLVFRDAFLNPKTKGQMGRNSAKAKWFVGITGQVATYNEWEELYGRKHSG